MNLQTKYDILLKDHAKTVERNIKLKDANRELAKASENARFDLHIRKKMLEKLTPKQLSILDDLEKALTKHKTQ